MSDLKTTKDMPIGGKIAEAGSSAKYKTGAWAARQPIYTHDKCTGCMFCINYCPEDCIKLGEDDKVKEIDLEICKGCGICVKVCKFDALKMEE